MDSGGKKNGCQFACEWRGYSKNWTIRKPILFLETDTFLEIDTFQKPGNLRNQIFLTIQSTKLDHFLGTYTFQKPGKNRKIRIFLKTILSTKLLWNPTT